MLRFQQYGSTSLQYQDMRTPQSSCTIHEEISDESEILGEYRERMIRFERFEVRVRAFF